MKKILKIEDLDCAHCAHMIEEAVSKIDGVNQASVNFLAQKMTLEMSDENCDMIIKKVIKAAKKIEPDCRVIV